MGSAGAGLNIERPRTFFFQVRWRLKVIYPLFTSNTRTFPG